MLDDLIDGHLTGSPGAWLVVATRHRDFSGSLTELLTLAAAT